MILSIALVLAVVYAANGGILPQTGLQYAYTGTPLTYSYSPYHYPLIRSAFPVLTTQSHGPLETKNVQPVKPVEQAKPLKPLKTLHYTIPQVVAPQLVYNALPQALIPAPVVQRHQFYTQDSLGSYHFGYYGDRSSRNGYRNHFGNVVGSYNYIDSEGKTQRIHYTAGNDDFNAAATTMSVAPIGALNPVQETPEVAQARFAVQAALNPVQETPEVGQASSAFQIISNPVQETPEVGQARSAFQVPLNPVQETPEVGQARSAFQVALIPVQETPEIGQARSAFQVALNSVQETPEVGQARYAFQVPLNPVQETPE